MSNTISTTGGAAGTPSPLSAEQLKQIQEADARRKKMGRAFRIADADAKITSFFAAIAILSALLFRDWSALAIGLALGVVAINSLRGSRRLRKMDTTAPRLLARNQLLLAFFLTLYFAWQMYSAWGMKDVGIPGIISPSDIRALEFDPKVLEQMIMAAYGLCIAATILGQGLMTFYYLTRKKQLEAYLTETPPWIVELQRAQRQ